MSSHHARSIRTCASPRCASGATSTSTHLDFGDIADGDDLAGIADVTVRQLGNMDQGILMHTDVDKRTEMGDVRDNAFKHHPGLQILDRVDASVELDRAEFAAGIASRFSQFGDDVDNRGDAKVPVDKILPVAAFDSAWRCRPVLWYRSQLLRHAADDRIAFGMDRRVVQRLVAAANSQKSGRLFERLLAQLRHLASIRLRLVKPAVAVAILDDILGQLRTDSGHVGQQGHAGHIQINAHIIDARFDHTVQALAELSLIDVVLVLSDADRFGIGFDQFRQRILQTTGDADRTADGDIQIRKLLARPVHWRNRSRPQIR